MGCIIFSKAPPDEDRTTPIRTFATFIFKVEKTETEASHFCTTSPKKVLEKTVDSSL
jgi:hypothetical protein